ncbi:MAG: recombinase family protein [Cytophagaceae bacterium]|nr:MAG: recombinase family protein [Cytophagaceae bacterium]
MSNLAYFRVSTFDQSIESQRHMLPGPFDEEFSDAGVSGIILAAKRPGFAALISYMRKGDTVSVSAIDRLGRDSIDIQTTYRDHFKAKGVRLFVYGLGYIEGEMGEIVLNLMAQFAEMDRNRIIARTSAGRAKAQETLAATGRTHNGKLTMGGSAKLMDPLVVKAWRFAKKASIAQTAKHFDISVATVKNYCRLS